MKIIVFSAPSGCGKTTIVKEIIKDPSLKLEFSISTTSRAPRGQEVNGVDYYFISSQQFQNDIKNDLFAEWQEVYTDNFYGTYKSEISRIDSLNKNIIFDIDVFGALNIKKIFKNDALIIFIMPPSIEELRSRLQKRATDSPEKIETRIKKAQQEIAQSPLFDKIVINDDLQKCISETQSIVSNFILSK